MPIRHSRFAAGRFHHQVTLRPAKDAGCRHFGKRCVASLENYLPRCLFAMRANPFIAPGAADAELKPGKYLKLLVKSNPEILLFETVTTLSRPING